MNLTPVTYCAIVLRPTTNGTNVTQPGDDLANWEEVFKTLNDSGMSRTDEPGLSVFDTILRVNARERSSGNGRSDTDVFLFEGDIVVNKTDITRITQGTSRRKRAVMIDRGRNLWPRNINYALHSGLGGSARRAIASAIREWESTLPCRGRWVDVTNRRKPSSYMLFFVGGGCYSQVGHVGGAQRVSIGRGCEHHGIAVHEIGHAMGLWHEQSRPDRDKYVRIIWSNIILRMQFNFQKKTSSSVNSLGITYDYDSVMHYGKTAFAKAGGLTTIASLRGHRTLGQRRGLSPKDKRQVQLLYKCSTTVKPTSPTVCSDSSSHRQWCIQSKKLSLCKNGLFKSYMIQHCCSTCKPKPTPPKPSGCQDEKNPKTCLGWKKLGYCAQGSRYYNFMKQNCCKTCKSSTNCGDDMKPSCPQWKKQGFCNDSRYKVYMTENCKKSCTPGCI